MQCAKFPRPVEAPQRWLPVHVSSCCHCSWTFAEVRGMRDSTEAGMHSDGMPNEKGCARCRTRATVPCADTNVRCW